MHDCIWVGLYISNSLFLATHSIFYEPPVNAAQSQLLIEKSSVATTWVGKSMALEGL